MGELIYTILIYSILLCTIILFISISYHLIKTISIKNNQMSLDRYKLEITTNIDEGVLELLDKIIQECFSEYTILNIEYRNDIDHVDAELEDIITREVCHSVIDKISPALISKISLIYNTNNFHTLLSQRVYLFTMDYSIKKNALKEKI